MLGPVVMPIDVAMRFYIAHSPPPLQGLLSSSYEELQKGGVWAGRTGQTPRGPSQAPARGGRCHRPHWPLRPCLSSTQRAPDGGKKRVVFADSRGLSLTAVRVFSEREAHSAAATAAAAAAAREDLMFQMTDLEAVAADIKERSSGGRLELDFPPPSGDYLDFRARLLRNAVCLESCALQGCSMTGTVKVRNLGFSKVVAVRVTFDSWATFADTACTFMNNVYGCRDTDTFAFALELPAAHAVAAQHRVEFCVRFRVEGQEFWDNNDGTNYALRQAGRTEKLLTSPASLQTPGGREKPGGPGGRQGGGGVRLLDVELDQFGSPRTSSGLFPGWQSWSPAEVSLPYW
ncbi:hypothetical protein NHX12_022615 [Muraenolepis orangiensis]|uniref:Protein phosphatase 1 regulatory subunit n=1 Tax=Muraenolepis orangiensis TaxID=630683 RepID=A0A9Q0EQI6_9TELE|nr:hypothetical protein NHX12_022615 [Muraenolepis orangiensis]